jgi:hypothetical protein
MGSPKSFAASFPREPPRISTAANLEIGMSPSSSSDTVSVELPAVNVNAPRAEFGWMAFEKFQGKMSLYFNFPAMVNGRPRYA